MNRLGSDSIPVVVPFLPLNQLTDEEERCYQNAHDRYSDAGITWHMTGWSDGSVHIQILDATREHAAAALTAYLINTVEGDAFAAGAGLTLSDDVAEQQQTVMQWITTNLPINGTETEAVMLQAWQFLETVEKHFFAKFVYESMTDGQGA
jgi:hypothetical protein